MCISNHNKKEWNLVVLTIVSSLHSEDGYFHICAKMTYQLKYRLYVFFSVDNFIKFSTHSQLTQSQKKTN